MKVWNFPNCIGAVDGKHVKVIAPQHSGSINEKFWRAAAGHEGVLLCSCCSVIAEGTTIDRRLWQSEL
ncbi:unnamed protein product [Acanthoscelides obtectus]|uniref:DDE Tnp4 domain-containing protein n=1 Tax=Acanthoscelides obtectus TaxID=200917 RepID=A0A9P0P8C0_ACAOB|nr:unnamed protein product [Acanthoscelides obtectus]CAK1681693.1 hypothetical protein AOBTE_LOCUS33221 [Acanthoscelides obtectus]